MALQGEDSVKKNVLLVETAGELKEAPGQAILEKANITQAETKVSTADQAISIAQDALKELLGITVSELKVDKPFSQMIAVGNSDYDVPVWNIFWPTLDRPIEGVLASYEKGEAAIPVESCGATINADTGEIISLYGWDNGKITAWSNDSRS